MHVTQDFLGPFIAWKNRSALEKDWIFDDFYACLDWDLLYVGISKLAFFPSLKGKVLILLLFSGDFIQIRVKPCKCVEILANSSILSAKNILTFRLHIYIPKQIHTHPHTPHTYTHTPPPTAHKYTAINILMFTLEKLHINLDAKRQLAKNLNYKVSTGVFALTMNLLPCKTGEASWKF